MNKVTMIARILMGLVFFVFGLNGFLQFIPMPTNTPAEASAFMSAIMATGYFFPVLKVTEIVAGLMLLSGFFVPLALVVLAPVVLHIVLYHVFLDPAGLAMGAVLMAMGIFLAWSYRSSFTALLNKDAKPVEGHGSASSMAASPSA